MTNLVERLHENIERIGWTLQDPDWHPLREYVEKMFAGYKEAAAEIARVTEEAWEWHNKYTLGAAEIERLRKDVSERGDIIQGLHSANTTLNKEVHQLEAEIERLREQIEAMRLVATANEPEALRQLSEIALLRMEIERLRTEIDWWEKTVLMMKKITSPDGS